MSVKSDQQATDINLDDKGEPEKVEAPARRQNRNRSKFQRLIKLLKTKERLSLNRLKKKTRYKNIVMAFKNVLLNLTRKMREAERQKEEAIAFAETTNRQKSALEGRLSKLDKSYTSEFENKSYNKYDCCQDKPLRTAIESQDVEGQVAAQEQIATS